MLSDTLHTLLLTSRKGCYVFTPDKTDSVSKRPWKRRKTELAKAPTNQNSGPPFAPLLKGLEKIESIQTRFEIFEGAWRQKETLLKVRRSS